MKVSKDGIIFPDRCPICRSRRTVVALYESGERYVECEGCWTVIGDVDEKRKVAISKNGKVWK